MQKMYQNIMQFLQQILPKVDGEIKLQSFKNDVEFEFEPWSGRT